MNYRLHLKWTWIDNRKNYCQAYLNRMSRSFLSAVTPFLRSAWPWTLTEASLLFLCKGKITQEAQFIFLQCNWGVSIPSRERVSSKSRRIERDSLKLWRKTKLKWKKLPDIHKQYITSLFAFVLSKLKLLGKKPASANTFSSQITSTLHQEDILQQLLPRLKAKPKPEFV